MTQEEFERQVPRLRLRMLSTAQRFFGDTDDAEDAVQEALAKLWQRSLLLCADRNLEALAVMVAKNGCVNIYRRREQMVSLDNGNLSHLAPSADETDTPLLERERRASMDEAIGRLQKREQQIVRMRFDDGQSTREIANLTGIPHPSVQSMLSAAKKKLKHYLKNKERE